MFAIVDLYGRIDTVSITSNNYIDLISPSQHASLILPEVSTEVLYSFLLLRGHRMCWFTLMCTCGDLLDYNNCFVRCCKSDFSLSPCSSIPLFSLDLTQQKCVLRLCRKPNLKYQEEWLIPFLAIS